MRLTCTWRLPVSEPDMYQEATVPETDLDMEAGHEADLYLEAVYS